MNDFGSGLFFVPLGGTGEIGMNLNAYALDGTFLAVDCGMGFADPDTPEADVLVADASFFAERRERLAGLVITHAHEDHIGGIAWHWRALQCPIFATAFAATLIRFRLAEAGLLNKVKIHEFSPGSTFEAGPFRLRSIRMAHSTPEAVALAIETRYGTVLHTGDWKIDPEPLVGSPTDEAALREVGDSGVLAMVSDSTNALVEGHSGSEATVRKSLIALIAGLKGRVAVTCFASNVARIASVIEATRHSGRRVALIGRSLGRYVEAAQTCGYLREVADFVPEDQVGKISDDRLLILVTGSQGEKRSALARIAADTHRSIAFGDGDTVIFSSRVIPGNERAIGRVQDDLVRAGVRVMTEADHMVHVSGHPARDDLRRLYKLVRPRYLIPTHGERRHLAAQAELAEAEQITTIMLEDGDVVELGPGKAGIVDSVPTGRLAVDGERLVQLQGGLMAARRRMLSSGIVIGSIAVDKGGVLRGAPKIAAPGLFEPDDPVLDSYAVKLADNFVALPAHIRRDADLLVPAAEAILRRLLGRRLGKHPLINMQIISVK